MSYPNTSSLSFGFSGTQNSADRAVKSEAKRIGTPAAAVVKNPVELRKEAAERHGNPATFSGKWAWYFPY